MATDGLVGAKRRGRAWKTTVANPAGCERPDLVSRDFTATRPDALWIADFTYLRNWEGVGFFSFVLDVYSRRCVGWQLSSNMRTDLVLDALRMALDRAPRRRPAAHPSQRSRLAIPRALTSPKPLTTTTCSARPATRLTTPWPRASSTASRPI